MYLTLGLGVTESIYHCFFFFFSNSEALTHRIYKIASIFFYLCLSSWDGISLLTLFTCLEGISRGLVDP